MVEIELTGDEVHNVASQWKKIHGTDLPGRFDGECLFVDESVSSEIESYDNSLYVPTEEQRKLMGFNYNGVMCSATKDDQNGLLAVRSAFIDGLMTETTFRFKNGSVLNLNAGNLEGFKRQWSAFRQSFFNTSSPESEADQI